MEQSLWNERTKVNRIFTIYHLYSSGHQQYISQYGHGWPPAWPRLAAPTLSELLWRTSYCERQSFLLSHTFSRELSRFCPGTGQMTVVVPSGSDTRQNNSFDATYKQKETTTCYAKVTVYMVATLDRTTPSTLPTNRRRQLHATLKLQCIW